jgi:hypothetical protein
MKKVDWANLTKNMHAMMDEAAQAEGVSPAELEAAMWQLFQEGRLTLEEFTDEDGLPNRRIVEVRKGAH